MFASVDFEHLNLATDPMVTVMYEPEQFPGFKYGVKDPEMALLLFAGGRIVCSRDHGEKQIYKPMEKLFTLLEGNTFY